ncbi:TniB family NTP-binding protein [Uliginosibacterium flavum]
MGRHKLEEPDCLLVTGVSGCGKSTLRKTYADRHPRVELEDRTVIPVLHLELPSQPTIKNVAERILMAMEDPFAARGSAESKTARIIKLLAECRVELVILDEFQHFVDRGRGVVDYKIADWLKQIINAARVPFVLMGLPRCERILEANEQLRRRFSARFELKPFSVRTKESAREFKRILSTLNEELPFPDRSVIAGADVVSMMFYATNGLIDYLIKLVSKGIEIAANEERNQIDLNVLARAFSLAIFQQCSDETNPFHPDFIRRVLNHQGEPFHGYA